MSFVDQIRANLVDPQQHGPVLEAIVQILEEKGERGVKSQIKEWVQDIQQQDPPPQATQE